MMATQPRPKMRISIFLLLACATVVHSWIDCEAEQGGGFCPDQATCCPTGTSGLSACIPTRPEKDPASSGECCDATSGCGFGFQCALDSDNKPFCKLDTVSPPEELSNDMPTYELCQIPSKSMRTLYGFPVLPHKQQLAYYSSMGPITVSNSDRLKKIEKVVVMIHGSGRNAEDYFCAGLSLVPKEQQDKVLVLAPRFLAPDDIEDVIVEYVKTNHVWFYQEEDETETDEESPPHKEYLVWENEVTDAFPLAHSWRYGADAINADISSYETLDRVIAYLVRSKGRFPNLKQVSVAGHSAGGQVTQRWALLSNEFFWKTGGVEIRAIAANPRSYCYLDRRRWVFDEDSNAMKFDIPSSHVFHECPDYNDWTWGFEQGGIINSPYKDAAERQVSTSEMAKRYGSRNIFYLTGEYDTIKQDDHCATYKFQGPNRHERAVNYFAALQEFYSAHSDLQLKHELYTIPESPHDHTLM